MKLFVGLPVYGGYDAHFVPCLLRLVQDPPVPLMIQPNPGDSLVSRARNRLVATFLKSDATHLLFLDTDLIFSPAQIGRLCRQAEAPGTEIVAGLYPKKQAELGWVCNLLDPAEGGPGEPCPLTDLHRVKYAGTGCLLVAREVFEAMIKAFPQIAYVPDDQTDPEAREWDFFSVGVYRNGPADPGRYLSEDWFFCQRARDLGYEIRVDTRVVLKHVGEAVYPLDDSTFQGGETPTENAEATEPVC